MSDMSAPAGETTGTPSDGEAGEARETDDGYQAKINERFDQLSGNLDRLAQTFERSQQDLMSRFEQPADDDDSYLLDEGDDGFEEQEAQRLIDNLKKDITQDFESKQAKMLAQRDADTAFDKMLERYPEMQDEQFQRQIIGEAAEIVGDLNPDAVHSPALIRVAEAIYKAHVADKAAAQETPAGSRREVQLETDGGAAPADREEDIQDRIIKAAESVSPRI